MKSKCCAVKFLYMYVKGGNNTVTRVQASLWSLRAEGKTHESSPKQANSFHDTRKTAKQRAVIVLGLTVARMVPGGIVDRASAREEVRKFGVED